MSVESRQSEYPITKRRRLLPTVSGNCLIHFLPPARMSPIGLYPASVNFGSKLARALLHTAIAACRIADDRFQTQRLDVKRFKWTMT